MSRPGIPGSRGHKAVLSGVQYRWLMAESEAAGIPLSETIRRVIDVGREITEIRRTREMEAVRQSATA
jgi:hypothetical protein